MIMFFATKTGDRYGILDMTDESEISMSMVSCTFYSFVTACVHEYRYLPVDMPWETRDALVGAVSKAPANALAQQLGIDTVLVENKLPSSFVNDDEGGRISRDERRYLTFLSLDMARDYCESMQQLDAFRASPNFERAAAQRLLLDLPKPLNLADRDLRANLVTVLHAAFPETRGADISGIYADELSGNDNVWRDPAPFTLLTLKGMPDNRYYVRKRGNTYHLVRVDSNEYGSSETDKEVRHVPIVYAVREDAYTADVHHAFMVSSRFAYAPDFQSGHFQRHDFVFLPR